jgi:hypothetical protein
MLTETLPDASDEERTEENLLAMGALIQVYRDVERAQREKFLAKWESVSSLAVLWKKLRVSLEGGA